jgi:hypothetical protein
VRGAEELGRTKALLDLATEGPDANELDAEDWLRSAYQELFGDEEEWVKEGLRAWHAEMQGE